MAPASAGISKVAWDHKNVSTSASVPGEQPNWFLLSSRCFKISKGVFFIYGPCAFRSGFCTGLDIQWVYTWPLEEWAFHSLKYYGLPGHITHWFSKTVVLESYLSFVRPRDLSAWCGTQIPCSSWKRSILLWSLPILDHCGWGVFFFPWQDHISASLISLNAVLLPFVMGLCSSSFQVPFPGNYSIFVNLLCPLEEVSSEFRIFLYYHLEPSTCMLYFYLSFYHMVRSYNTEESNSL